MNKFALYSILLFYYVFTYNAIHEYILHNYKGNLFFAVHMHARAPILKVLAPKVNHKVMNGGK